jgi:uncharacterized MAPEG superfamily protein
MTTPILVLLVLCVLPIVFSSFSGYCRFKQFGDVDNKNPRLQNTQLTGAGQRAVAAQQNAWEALILYSAALLAVTIAQVPVEKYAMLALVLMVARIAHGVFYIANLDILRSLSFIASYGIGIYMLILAL